jgi:hypothetical protein
MYQSLGGMEKKTVTAIGLLNEKSLHSALKHWHARPSAFSDFESRKTSSRSHNVMRGVFRVLLIQWSASASNWPYLLFLHRDDVDRRTRAAVKTRAGREMGTLTPLEFENPMPPRRTVISR